VLLTLNDQPIGSRQLAEAIDGVLTWDVPYAAGVLKAAGRMNGRPAAEFVLTTAGEPARIELAADVTTLAAGASVAAGSGSTPERQIVHVEFRIVDRQGVRVPSADHTLTFTLDGPARMLAIGNGDLNSTEDCTDLVHRAYQGRGLAILEATRAAGRVTLTVTSPGLEAGMLAFSIGATAR
jgi:beta-galactosidase